MENANSQINPPDVGKHCKKVSKPIVILFLILTISMVICGKMFSIFDWINHPQFTEKLVDKAWFDTHVSNSNLFIFRLFFILDFIWAFLLFYIVGNYVCKKAKMHDAKWVFYLFLVLACIAYTFDCTENFYYLFNRTYPATVVMIKIVAYALAFFTALTVWIRFSLKNRLVILKEFVTSSWISLLFLFIIGLILSKAPQLNSIIVDLYYHPWWFVVALLLFYAPIYCIVLSHYPTYFLLSRSNRKFKDKEWRMTRIFSFFGIVWYKNKKHQCSCNCHTNTCCDCRKEEEENDGLTYESNVSFLRRVIGILFYVAIFYMIAYTADTNFDLSVKFSGFSKVLAAVLIWWLYVLKNQKNPWRLYYEVPFYEDKKAEKPATINPFSAYIFFFILTIVAHIVLLFSLSFSECPYTSFNVAFSLICIMLQAITYTYYRTFRSLFKYAFFNKHSKIVLGGFPMIYDHTDTRSREEKERDIIQRFEKNAYFGQTTAFKILSSLRFGAVSNNIIFLKIIACFGVINLLLLLITNIWPSFALKVNAIIIIIATFFLFYGIIVIILKHFIYYNLSKEPFAINNKKKFFFTVYVMVLGLFILNHLARFNDSTKNNLFELKQVKNSTEKDIALRDYVTNLSGDTRYYIGCYGGGMKANAWTMTVLNTLNQDNTLFDKTICMSGASGGTIGLINYAAITHEYNAQKTRDSIIREISTENILSVDLTHLLGRDWITHMFFPMNLEGEDRSTAAMRIYAKHVDSTFSEKEFQNKPYRQYWKEMYAKRGNRFPILISNSTNIKGRQGMAVSVNATGIPNRILYLGANDILQLPDGKTLSYYNAASTTNRFPLISPAATIEGEGQYNDGGIYENSGLLSAYKLYEAINTIDATAQQKKTVFINIVNDKTAYIKSRMNTIMDICNGGVINKSSELSAILNSVAATEMFPGYIKDKLQLMDDQKGSLFSFESIYLPHKFSLDDVKAIYGPKFDKLDCVEQIDEIIQDNNKEIDRLMKDCSKSAKTVIEPAMSRVMAIPAYNFMEYMLEHSRVKPVLEKLK